MKYRIITGIVIIVIDIFLIYYRSDIIIEMFSGRSWNQLDIFKLLLPLILLIIGVFLIFKKEKK